MMGAGEGGAAMRARIAAMLDSVERDHRVSILLAIESGSRAWGFPSSDSDWDVRFVYLRPLDAYLRIDPLPEVIEVPVTDELDLSGWDLRKALALLVASNAVVLEWLSSPVIYRRDEQACAVLTELALAAAHLPALSYHYDRSARRHWGPAPGVQVRFKTLFYALRAALALVWLRSHGRAPPMDLDGLMAGLSLRSNLGATIERLRGLKLIVTEADSVDTPSEISAFLSETLAHPVCRPGAWDKSDLLAKGSEVFCRMTVDRRG